MAKIPTLTPEEFSKFLKKEKLGFAIMAALFAAPFCVWAAVVARSMYAPFLIQAPVTVVINKNDGFFGIGDKLAATNAVPNPGRFKLYALVTGKARTLKEGTYVLSGKYSIASLVDRLAQGPEDITVVIPEGFTAQDIDNRLATFGLIQPGDFVNEVQQVDDFSYPFLASDSINSLEGYLFPDTYRFAQKTTVRQVVRKMLDNFEQKVYAKLDDTTKQNQQAFVNSVILASLVERESDNSADRKIIAGILWKRLEANMPLQVDATIIYAWKQRNPNWKPGQNGLSLQDLKIKSLYNTYSNKGLPPAPISNPGIDAINAALHPQDSEYWFYLSSKDGTTIFSKTIDEHNAAKRKYL